MPGSSNHLLGAMPISDLQLRTQPKPGSCNPLLGAMPIPHLQL
jgi:hypothetical protein